MVTTWERALAFDPSRWTVRPQGNPFQLYAYPSVYGACLMSGYRGASGRAKTQGGAWIQISAISGTAEPPTKGGQDVVDTAIDDGKRTLLIVELLHELPKRERYVIAEHYLGGVPLASIAESLHTSRSSITRIHLAGLDLLRLAVARRGVKTGAWL
jgi:DNA-directed RNA polymerase specialized sigma24 family protein